MTFHHLDHFNEIKVPSDEVRTECLKDNDFALLQSPSGEVRTKYVNDNNEIRYETNNHVAKALKGKGGKKHRIKQGCVDFADAEPTDVVVQETLGELPLDELVAILNDVKQKQERQNSENRPEKQEADKPLAVEALDVAKEEIEAKQKELEENRVKYYGKLAFKYGIELASKLGYITGLGLLSKIKIVLVVVRLSNSITRKLGFDFLKPIIAKIIGNEFPLTQESQNLLENKDFKEIYEHFVKKDASFKQYTSENLGKRDFEIADSTDLKVKTTAMLGKLFSLGIRENFYDALRADKFKTLLSELMQILDNVEQIEYLAKEEFSNKLEHIDQELNNIEDSGIKLRLLDRRYLKNYDAKEIQLLIHAVIACYAENRQDASHILTHSEILAKYSLKEWFDDVNHYILENEIQDRLQYLYMYSNNPKLLECEKMMYRLARTIKILIKIDCAEKLQKLHDYSLIPLEEDLIKLA